jgi:hemerythrin
MSPPPEKEDLLRWHPGMPVGVEFLDRQHQRIISTLNKYCAAGARFSPESLAEALSIVSDYAHEHLVAEERFLAQHGYPGLARHLEEHDWYRKTVASMSVLALGGGDPNGEALCDFVSTWWIEHIQSADKEYSAFLHKIGVAPC